MRTITHQLYKFEELEALEQRRAIDEMRESIAIGSDECDCSEYRTAILKIEEAFGIKVYDYDYQSFSRRWGYGFKFKFTEQRWDTIADKRDRRILLRYFNAVDDRIRKEEGRYYSTPGKYVDGMFTYKSRHSKVLFYPYNYCLTGTWCTEAVDDALNDFADFYRKGITRTIREFVTEMLDEFFGNWKEDIEYHWSDDYIRYELEQSEYEFYEDGKVYICN